MAAPPTLEEMRLACANADTDSNRFGKPIASNASASSPARSDDSEVYTQVELEAWEDTLEVTSNSAGDKRAPSSKPKPSGPAPAPRRPRRAFACGGLSPAAGHSRSRLRR